MSFKINTVDYLEYLERFYLRLSEEREYVTELDLATGDGDHWANMNLGFKTIIEKKDELKEKSIDRLFKAIGMNMMSVIGGSSGVLYGGAYMAASKVLKGKDFIEKLDLLKVWEAMLTDIMARGNAKPGDKTMIDSLYYAVEEYKKVIDDDEKMIMTKVSEAAMEGAMATKEMEAMKGRATYQQNKGVGHLDPGSVTMAMQIQELCNYIIKEKL